MNLDSYSNLIASIGIFYLGYVGIGALKEYYSYLKSRYDEKFKKIRELLVLNNIRDVDFEEFASLVKANIFFNRASEVHPIRIKELFVKWAIFCVIILVYTGIQKDLPWVKIHMLAYLNIFFVIHIFWRLFLLVRKVKKATIKKIISDKTETENKYYPFTQCYEFENVSKKPFWFRMMYKICKCQLFPNYIGENNALDIFIRSFIFSLISVIVLHIGKFFPFDFFLNPGVFKELTIFITIIVSLLAYPVAFLLDIQMVIRLHLHLRKADISLIKIEKDYNQSMEEKVDEIIKWLDESINKLE
jgi:hypothetical protein